MTRIVSCDDVSQSILGCAYTVVCEYLNEALGRYDVRSFAPYGTFYFLNTTPTLSECLSMGFECSLDSVKFDYTDEIHINADGKETILFNPTYIFPDNDYVVSIFAFSHCIDKKTQKNFMKYVDTYTYKTT